MNEGPRPIRPEETPALHALIESAYGDYGVEWHPSSPEESHVRDPGPTARASGGELWVVSDGADLIGSCALHLKEIGGERIGEIKTMYVLRSSRGRGLGRQLLETAIDHARAHSCARVMLWSDTMFTDAHGFYERMGFTREGLRRTDGWSTFEEYGFYCDL